MRYFKLAICIIYLLVSLFFYQVIWMQILKPEDPSLLLVQGETPVYEFVAEHVRLNILSGKNPFASTDRLLYPMGWNIAMEDIAPINGFLFLFLRPFFSIHQSFIVIMLASVFASNITMYMLLRKVGIRRSVAFLTGLLFGFTPFVSYRITGHPTYIAMYLFTVPAIFFISLYNSQKVSKKIFYAILLGSSFVLMLLTNLYFVIMFALLIGIWVFFSFLFQFKESWQSFIAMYKYFIVSGITAFTLLIPWIIEFIANVRFNPRSVPTGFADNIAFSADIFGFFWPRHVMIARPMVEYIIKNTGYKPFFEALIYPGILLVVTTFLYLKYKKAVSKHLQPVYLTALTLLVFTFGPFLKIGIYQSSIPLPYLIIHYLPYFQMARAPGRFIAPFVFLMCIVFAFLMQLLLKKTLKKQWIVYTVILVIFFIDQWLYIAPPLAIPIPRKIYSYLLKQPPTPLLEIPFTIRDGLKNHGHLHSVWSVEPQYSHNHPLFGIYAGRVPDNQFAWFQTHPFFGPLGMLMNIDNQDKLKSFNAITQNQLNASSNFLGFQYVLLKEKEDYSSYSAQLLSPQFKPIQRDNGYTLYQKKNRKRALTTSYRFSTKDTQWILQDGWSSPEKEGRWAVGAISTLFLNAKPQGSKLVFKARSIQPKQKLSIYINRKKLDTQLLTQDAKVYTVYVPSDVLKDLNMIQFIPSRVVQPSSIDPSNKDSRELSIFYESVAFQ